MKILLRWLYLAAVLVAFLPIMLVLFVCRATIDAIALIELSIVYGGDKMAMEKDRWREPR